MLSQNPNDITPFFPEKNRDEINDLILKLATATGKLSAAMHPLTARAVSALVVNMNSYYSNLIEGQYTHPHDIERALKNDYSADEKKRILQQESIAHIQVNEAMRKRLAQNNTDICTADFLCWLHGEFYKHLPDSLRYVKGTGNEMWEVTPGHLRTREVEVGKHVAPAANALAGFMDMFNNRYAPPRIKNPVDRVLAIAAAHHRLAWIHPFLDGNGRVIRLFSEAYFITEGMDANGLWSISRGLARKKDEYYAALNNADMLRLNDYDGRGNLSDRYLAEFCLFFLHTAIDQVTFMSSLFEIDLMMRRIDTFTDIMVSRDELRTEARDILKQVFLRGSVEKGVVMHIINKSDTIARPLTNRLVEMGLLIKNDGHFAPLTMGFPARYARYLFPNLFPAQVEATLD